MHACSPGGPFLRLQTLGVAELCVGLLSHVDGLLREEFERRQLCRVDLVTGVAVPGAGDGMQTAANGHPLPYNNIAVVHA